MKAVGHDRALRAACRREAAARGAAVASRKEGRRGVVGAGA